MKKIRDFLGFKPLFRKKPKFCVKMGTFFEGFYVDFMALFTMFRLN